MYTGEIKIYAIVVTYNGIHWIDKCLGSLKNSTIPVQTIVIDNHSSDNTVRFIQSAYPEVLLIENKENQGFGKANNTGIKQALADKAGYIYLLNQDAWMDSNVMEGLVQLMETNPQYGIISPMQYTRDGKNLDEGFQHVLSPGICDHLLNDLVTNNLKSDLYPTRFVMAAHWMVRSAALEDTGGFLPLFKHYGEDKNLINRMLFYGWKTGIAPGLKGYHDREHRKESNETKLHIQYAQYLAHAANINKPAVAIFKYFLRFSVNTLRSEGTIVQRTTYLCKVFMQIIPVFYYRYLSKNTKNKHGLWI
jgi:GT2 family glycosyltransferase